MGTITLAKLPDYLDRWGVRYDLVDGWLDRGRKSGGFDGVRAIGVHHSASPTSMSLDTAIRYCTETATDRPIGNGTISRDKDGPKLVLWAGKASNTQGKGGPRLSARGVIPLDAANAVTVAWEAENNGTGEPWPDDMCDLYVKVCAASIEWANAETPGAPIGPGDVMAHFEWAPRRKIDPWGPCRFNDHQNVQWNMDLFRGEVFSALMNGPEGAEPAPPAPVAPGDYVVQKGDGWYTISRALGFSIAELQQYNSIDPGATLVPGQVIRSPLIPVAPPVPYTDGTPLPTMGVGGTGDGVANLQDVLRFWGWMPADFADDRGTFGDWTWQGVVNMQLAINVPADGVYNEATAAAYSAFVAAMRAVPAPCSMPPPLSPGASGPDVVDLQRFLASNGWYGVALDGQYGPLTMQGVQKMQKYARTSGADPGPIDGIYGQQTRDAICPLV